MKNTIKILIIILALLILLIFLLSYKNTFSSFFSKITGKSNTEVAEPIFLMENSEKKVLNDNNTEIDYYFTIKNFNADNKRSETDLTYTIEITPKVNSSIILTLYRDNQIITLNNQKTALIEMKQNSNTTHSYRLNVKYDREKTNATTDIKENIFIKASASQS